MKTKNFLHIRLLLQWMCLGLLTVLFLFIYCNQAQANDLNDQQIILKKFGSVAYSSVMKKDEPFYAVMIQSDDQVENLMVNFDPLNKGLWQNVEIENEEYGVEAMIFTSPKYYLQFKSTQNETFTLKISFVPFSDISNVVKQELYAGPSSSNTSNIITRQEWGADENYRFWTPELEEWYKNNTTNETKEDPCADLTEKYEDESKVSHIIKTDSSGEQLIWPLAYSEKISKIIIHHTASEIKDVTGDNLMDVRDYQAIVRAIYHFHAKTRAWGDIGYNYLIDPLGNVYEGRYGGEKVIGAHVLCYNNGTIGIALIGNYQDNLLPDPALKSLINLVAQKSKLYNLDPRASSTFRGKFTYNIGGHKDYSATACPGKNIYNLLTQIREYASLAIRSINLDDKNLSTTTLDYDAEFVGSESTINLLPNETKKVTIKFKNTGKKSWDNNTWLHVGNNKKDGTRIIPVVSDKLFVAADMTENTVSPGGIGTFQVEIGAGYKANSDYFEVSPVVNGEYRISHSAVFLATKTSASVYKYEVVNSNLPIGIVYQGQKIKASIILKNTGNVTWVNHGENPIRMGTENLRDRVSLLTKIPSTRIGHLLESEVKPGSTGTFIFDLEIPNRLTGSIEEYFSPVIEHVTWLENKNLNFKIDIKQPIYKAQISTNTSQRIKLLPGEMKKMTINMKNLGDISWNEDNMKVNFLANGIKIFKNNLSPTTSIKKNETTDFEFWIQAPYDQGSHFLFLNSFCNGFPIQDGTIRMFVDVDNPWLRAVVSKRSPNIIDLKIGEEKEVEIKFKNLGNTIWNNKGSYAIYLAPTRPKDHMSKLYNDSWYSKYRTAEMVEKEVKPGEIGTFKFKIKLNQAGIFTEYFQLVVENKGWLNDTLVRWDFNVSNVGSNSNPISGPNGGADSGATSASCGANCESNLSETTTSTTGTATAQQSAQQLEQPFRVKLSYSDNEAKIKADKDFKVVDGNNNILLTIKAGDYITIENSNNIIYAHYYNSVRSSNVIRLVPDSGGIIEIMTMENRPAWNTALNDNKFRGVIEIRSINNKIIFINELPLEDYLKGLAEVSNNELAEKQKAIAVLARTYARFYMDKNNRKFPGLPYDGSDDPAIFQKYLGYGVESRSPNFVSAVNVTKDKVVTYNGNLVKTPYFNQSDGKTRSAKEVWGWTTTPYLQEVDDPYCKGLTMSGHGVGMSGCGATGMAKAGKTYEEIIKYYYQGVKISNWESN